MARKKQGKSNKHLDFVALLRGSMHVPPKEASPATIVTDTVTENELDSQLMQELQRKLEELFGPLD